MKLSFAAIFLILLISCSNEKKYIGLQPYSSFDLNLIDTLANTINKSYGYEVVKLPERKLPKNAFVNIKSARYRADTLLIDLKTKSNDSISYVLGLTNSDISTTKKTPDGKIKEPKSKYQDWGVMGLGYRPGRACIVSTYRLQNSNQALFISRLKKVCTHEIGHNLGLDHCPNEGCVMMDAAETVKTVDKVGYDLCIECMKQIGSI